MSRRLGTGIALAGVLLAAVGATGAAGAAPASTSAAAAPALDARLAALERTVARLRAERGARRDERRARRRTAAVSALLDAALRDAATRTAGRDGPLGGGGFDGRPRLRSADGRFELGLAAHVQVRFVASVLGDAGPGEDPTVAGTELRRTRLKAVGHVLDERLRYQLGGGFSNDGDPFSLTDAWVEWRDAAGGRVRVGNFRPIFLREELTSAKRLPGVERSLVSRLVRQLRRPGVMVRATMGEVRGHVAIQDPGAGSPGDAWRASARVELRLAGDWRPLRQETGVPGTEAAGALGLGVLHRERAGGRDRTQATVDALWLDDGWSLTVVGVLDDPDGRERGWGATARVGRFVDERLELVGRVQVGDAEDELLTIGGGANLYLDGHGLKLQADVVYALDGPGGRWRTVNTGWRAESGDGQIVVRMQGQVAF